MNVLQAITALRDTRAHSALDAAIDDIRDDLERGGSTMQPEERDHTRLILDRLLDLQAHAIRSATRRGEVLSARLSVGSTATNAQPFGRLAA